MSKDHALEAVALLCYSSEVVKSLLNYFPAKSALPTNEIARTAFLAGNSA
jgi:hypothetical protein